MTSFLQDSFIGMPNPNVASAIESEHLYSEDSHVQFSLNNLICTPAQEYEFVLYPQAGTTYPGLNTENNPREIQEINTFLNHKNFSQAKLLREELIALRLYTGPMFCKYNAVLRKFPKEMYEGLHGNGYTTTIHAIVSGIIKLSQIMVLPGNRKVMKQSPKNVVCTIICNFYEFLQHLALHCIALLHGAYAGIVISSSFKCLKGLQRSFWHVPPALLLGVR